MSNAKETKAYIPPIVTTFEPASGDSKTDLEETCNSILNKKKFGQEEFTQFVKNLIYLVGGVHKDYQSHEELNSSTEPHDLTMEPRKLSLHNREGTLFVRLGFASFPDHPHIEVYTPSVRQNLFTKKFDRGGTRRVFVVCTSGVATVPDDIMFPSPLTNSEKQVFPTGNHAFIDTEELTEREAQEACRIVYNLYLNQ